MRRRDEPDVNFMRTVAAESLEFLLLQDAQQFRLQLQRYVADFVKKQRTSVGQLEPPRLLRDSAGKCTFFVAKQLTLQKSKRDCRAVQLHECPFAATA